MLGPLRKGHGANGYDANRGNQHVESDHNHCSSRKYCYAKNSSTATTITIRVAIRPNKDVPLAFETRNDAASIPHFWTWNSAEVP